MYKNMIPADLIGELIAIGITARDFLKFPHRIR